MGEAQCNDLELWVLEAIYIKHLVITLGMFPSNYNCQIVHYIYSGGKHKQDIMSISLKIIHLIRQKIFFKKNSKEKSAFINNPLGIEPSPLPPS